MEYNQDGKFMMYTPGRGSKFKANLTANVVPVKVAFCVAPAFYELML
jgi:hypothetical protein